MLFVGHFHSFVYIVNSEHEKTQQRERRKEKKLNIVVVFYKNKLLCVHQFCIFNIIFFLHFFFPSTGLSMHHIYRSLFLLHQRYYLFPMLH